MSLTVFLVRRRHLTIAIEREALLWVQKYISAFGGDPDKVTMYVMSFVPSPERIYVY